MRRSILLELALLPLLGFALRTWGAEPIDPGQIEPFVNEYTLAVARLDVSGIDPDAVDRWATEAIASQDRHAMGEEFGISGAQARDWAKQFREAGGKVIWLLLTVEPVPSGSPVVAVVPIGNGTDAQALKRLFTGIAPSAQVLRAHGALVIGQGSLEWINAIQPTARPQLAKALSAVEHGQLRAALIPSEDARKVIESMAPTLPAGRSGGSLARGFQWAAAAIQLPPDPAFQAIVQTPDENSSKAIQPLIKSLLNMFRQPPGGTGDQVWKRLINAAIDLTSATQVRGDQLVIALDSRQATALAGRVIGGLYAAHEQALRERSAGNLMRLLRGWVMYANDYKGRVPDTLAEMIKDQDISPQVLVNARRPADTTGYIYIKPPEGIGAPAQRMVMHEKFDHFDGGINAGFADGHVEWIDSEAKFQELLKAAEDAVARPKTK